MIAEIYWPVLAVIGTCYVYKEVLIYLNQQYVNRPGT
jgi:hypothetical protein